MPVFIVSYKERVEEVLNLLIAMLPGKPNADESQAVQIHMSLALGMFISRLCEEKVRYEFHPKAGVQITFASSHARYSDYAAQHV